MSLTSMNNAYQHRRYHRESEVCARIKAGRAIIRLMEHHPEIAERYARLLQPMIKK